MKPLRVLSIFGTRPEAVKMAPVVQALARTPGIEARVCVTAQHRQMLDQVLNLFGIQPDIDLDLMREDQTLPDLTASIFTNLSPVLADLKPDWILVQGDTTTVMASALAAYYQHIRVGHVEAGLRTGDKWSPFPEEINRRVAGVVADLHFPPTELARQNLLRENVPDANIVVTGNTVIDALLTVADQPAPLETLELLAQLGVPASGTNVEGAPRLVMVTAHRRENFGAPLENICQALRTLAELYPDLRIVYSVHRNPNVWGPVHRLLEGVPNITLLPPLDYLPMVQMLKRSTMLLTDSGGLQEEAPSLKLPVLVLRDVTERPEGIEAGTLRLVGTDCNRIVSQARRLLDEAQARLEMTRAANPYGDGQAAQRIVDALLSR